MEYNITISGTECDDIQFKSEEENNTFKTLKFWIDTVEENANNRSSNIRNKVELRMEINEKTSARCRQLMDWSLLTQGEDVYRTVQIEVLNNTGVIRSFRLEEMFVDDYLEIYGEDANSDAGLFVLQLIQKAGKRERFRQDSKKIASN